MEEGSEEHMDTGVSSTTGEGQEAPAPVSSHHDVETVIIVEAIKDEDTLSPHKNSKTPEIQSPVSTDTSHKNSKTPERQSPVFTDTSNPILKPPQQEVPIKKIIIKSPLKDLQGRLIQRSPYKPEEPKTSRSIEFCTILSIPSSSPQKIISTADSSGKSENTVSQSNTGQVNIKNAVVGSSASDGIAIKSLSKNSPAKKDIKEPENSPKQQAGSPTEDSAVKSLSKDSPAKKDIKEPEHSPNQQAGSPREVSAVKSPSKDSPAKKDIKETEHSPNQQAGSPREVSAVKSLSKDSPAKKDIKETEHSPNQQAGSLREDSAVKSLSKDSPVKKDIKESEHSPNQEAESPVVHTALKSLSKGSPAKKDTKEPENSHSQQARGPVVSLSKDSLAKKDTQEPENFPKQQLGSPRVQPIKIIFPKDSSVKTVSVKSPDDKASPNKKQQNDCPSESVSVKDISVNPPIKITIPKDAAVKNIPLKDPAITASAETPKAVEEKQTPNKEKQVADKMIPSKKRIILKRSVPVKDKQTPSKETPVKDQEKEMEFDSPTAPLKERENKGTPAKESPSKANATESRPTRTHNRPEEPYKNKNISLMDDTDASNDSHLETNSDTSEKEHNKSISRELRSLINSAKESKIISECTQLTSKTRKSRSALDSANTSVSSPADPEKIQSTRRYSDNSQRSTSSDKSEKAPVKRSMRSNHDMPKIQNSVSREPSKDRVGSDDESREKPNEKESTSSLPKKKKTDEVAKELEVDKKTPDKGSPEKRQGLRADPYCWRCHWSITPTENEKPLPSANCSVCPRSFHSKCISGTERNKVHTEKNWVCPECILILQAESSESRSATMKKISLGMLCDLLKYALERMMEVNGVEPFTHPVDRKTFPDYDKYVVHPMDLSLMKKNIEESLYGSTEAFLADAQWILHNSIIFNTFQAKLTGGARALVRACRAEMGEIEACPECYAAAHARRPTWFTDVCSTPHILLWAKLKGFPYWPAKGMSINNQGLVDVRFFGAHDRAWVPARDCFLYSEKDPNNFRTKRQDILDSMQEAEQHIRNIKRKYGKFVPPPFKTQFDPTKWFEQIKLMIPSFEGEVQVKDKSSSTPGTPVSLKKNKSSQSKSSKASTIEGDVSEGEESTTTTRKMPDGGEIEKVDDDFAIDKDKDKSNKMEVDPLAVEKETPATRKRRRSELEEAVITIIDTPKEKRIRVDREAAVEKKDAKSATEDKVKNQNEDKEKTKCKDVPAKEKEPGPKSKETDPTASTKEKKASPKVGPIRVISIAKVLKDGRPIKTFSLLNKKEDDKTEKTNDVKVTVSKEIQSDTAKKDVDKEQKSKDETPIKKAKLDKSISEKDKSTPQEDKSKRRNSNKNKSLNISNTKLDKTNEKCPEVKEKPKDNATKTSTAKADKTNEKPADVKEKPKDNTTKTNATKANSSKKYGGQIDDNTSLAVLAKEAKGTLSPIITNVVSLSNNKGGKSIEVTVEAASSSSIFTPTSTDSCTNMKEAVNKLQRLRGENQKKPTTEKQISNEKQTSSEKPPQVGRVGVKSFARMTSPPPAKQTQNEVQVEIKSEPIDYEETEKQMQDKIEMMNTMQLRPVNTPMTNLRDVRINKFVVTSGKPGAGQTGQNKTKSQPQPAPSRAKKTFPQPKKPDEGRSELTCKNSMVYIPIQPPMTQAPVRGMRPVGTTLPSTPPQPRAGTPMIITSSASNSTVNTTSTPLVVFSSPSTSATSSAPSTPSQGIPTVGQVPSTVHTMPLITSVNGQWTFSLQPVLSVGGVDNAASPPMVNGISERPPVMPVGSGPVLVPAAALPNASQANALTTASPSNNSSGTPLSRELPRLQQRPSVVNPLDDNAPLSNIPPPSTAGPYTAKLNQNAAKMAEFFRSLLEDCVEKVDDPNGKLTALRLQLEKTEWRYQQTIEEMKHNYDLVMAEMRASFEKEKQRVLTDARRQAQLEIDTAVKNTKAKQWCANCYQEAQFYCCWNTSYCDYGCQRAHWATHYAVCTQSRTDNSSSADGSAPERLQPAPENLPKTTAAPNMALSKLQPGRVYTQEQATPGQKPSIIVSMVEDPSGNQTMKCVGTFKPPGQGPPPNMSPLILNKQLLNSEEAKKVVTSGGYLIVGASNSAPNTSTITPARRTHAIQYIS